jgi:tetratricopeptide (TPR) repeat protein
MKVLFLERKARRRTLWIEILLLVLLVCVAGYVWTAPNRAERALRQASLSELQAETRRNPNQARAFYYQGRRLQEAGQLTAAYDAFAHAAQLDGDDEQSWLATAALASQLYGDQGAFDLLDAYVRRHPESARAHLALAQLYRKNQSHRRAREEALAAANSDPHLAEAWYLAGLSTNSLGSPSEAEAALRRAVAEAPKEWRYPMILGDILALEKRSQEALRCDRQAIRLAPDEGVTYLSLGKLQLELAISPAEIETARQNLLRSAALQPEIPITYLLIGRSYIRQARWQEAQEAVERAARLAPTDPDPVFELARISRRLGDTAAAEHLAERHRRLRQYVQQKQALKEKIVTFKNEAPGLRLELARLCAANGDTVEASEQYRRYLEITPGAAAVRQELARLESRAAGAAQAAHPVAASETSGSTNGAVAARLQQADALYAQKRYPEAERAYIRVLHQDKRSALARQGLGLTLAAEGKSDRSLVFLLSAVKLDPDLAPAQYALSQAYMAIDAPAEARRRMMDGVRREPGNPAYWHLLGMACSGAEPYYAQAEDALRHAVTREPRNARYLLDLADILMETGKSGDAEAAYRQALALAPEEPDTLARCGMFFAREPSPPEQQQEAETLLQKALRRSPNDSYTLYALGRLNLERGDGKQAAAYLRRAIACSTQIDTAELWYLLARAYRLLGDQSHAEKAQAISRGLRDEYQMLRHMEERADQSPQDAGLRLTLARLYTRRGENARAIDTYQTCLQLDPNNAPARSELVALEKRLRAGGKMPLMIAFCAMIAAAGQPH